MALVIDDHLLLDVLAGIPAGAVANELERGGVFTTSCWYYRLGRAVVAGSGAGSLSGRLQALGDAKRRDVLAALQDLPQEMGLITPRVAVPVMLALRVRRSLNMLNAEALAIALLVEGTLVVSTDSPILRSSAADLRIEYQVSA